MSARLGLLAFAAALLAPLAAEAKTPDQAPLETCLNKANTTIESNECFAADVSAAEAALARYSDAARKVLKSEEKSPDSFAKGAIAWEAYRKAYCDAVYDRWADGTIRNAQALSCRAALTRDRTHEIWSDYLVPMDSSKPALPEPK